MIGKWLLHEGLAVTLLIIMICRLDLMRKEDSVMYRLACVVMGGSAGWVAVMPLYDDMPTRWPGILMMSAIVALLCLSMPRWRHGPPRELRRRKDDEQWPDTRF